jgi:hypothetical protein
MIARALIVLALVSNARVARADSDSLLTLGIGTGFGVIDTVTSAGVVTSDVRLRARILRGLGLEVSYDPKQSTQAADAAVHEAPLRVSGLFYIVPTSPVGAYLKLGVAAPSPATLGLVGSDVTYHAGGGIEIYLGDHLVLGAEAVVIIPTAKDSLEASQQGADGRELRLRLSDIRSGNYRAMATLMYYM